MSLMNVSPRLGDNVPGEWRMRLLQGDMNSTSDKSLMTFAAQAPPGYWPIYKGETFDIWNVDKGPTSYYAWGSPATLTDYLQQKRVRSYRNIASAFSEFDEAWVQNLSTLPSMVPRLAYRAVSRSTDSRTIRAALVPANIFLVHSAPFLIWPHGDEADQAFLLGCLCSLVLDWYARRFIESNVQFIQLNSFPIPRPKRQHPLWRLAISLSGRLAAPDERFADWAKAVGVKHGPLEADEKEDMIHELDAAVAHLYGLSESQLRHIFETFHVGWNYEDRLVSTLDHYHRLESKL
jgi:hypothetical protein